MTDDSLDVDGEQTELADRHSLRRVAGMSTQLVDISEVEYRELQLERVVLVSVWTTGSEVDVDNSLAELKLLAETAGSEVLEGLVQRRSHVDPATFIGRGKVDEVREVVIATGADTVICDGELDPAQLRNLEDRVGVTPSSSTSSPSTPAAPRARPRSSWRNCSTCGSGSGAGAATSPGRPVDGRRPAPVSAAAAPARPRSRSTGGGSRHASPRCGAGCANWTRCARRNAPSGAATRCRRWRSSATPTRASPRC
jgi:hypothetical protein